MRRSGLFVVLALSLIAPLSAENWPNWRGPASTGVSPGVRPSRSVERLGERSLESNDQRYGHLFSYRLGRQRFCDIAGRKWCGP